MAPQEPSKPLTKIQRNVTITKATVTKPKSSPVNTLKKVFGTRNVTERSSGKANSNDKVMEPKRRTNTLPKVITPKSKENKPTVPPSSVTKSAKKALWKWRPKPAHSGVPIPEKMRRFFESVSLSKKVIATRNVTERSSGKANSNDKVMEPKRRTNTLPKVITPKSKENKPTVPPSSVTKSAKKALWNWRPKPAHSGVPFPRPEKLRRFFEKLLQDRE